MMDPFTLRLFPCSRNGGNEEKTGLVVTIIARQQADSRQLAVDGDKKRPDIVDKAAYKRRDSLPVSTETAEDIS